LAAVTAVPADNPNAREKNCRRIAPLAEQRSVSYQHFGPRPVRAVNKGWGTGEVDWRRFSIAVKVHIPSAEVFASGLQDPGDEKPHVVPDV
jgi:hypothetical protein